MGIISQGKRLLDALFTRTQRQLLGLLFGHPDRSFYLNEIVRLAGVGTGSVQRELGRLTEAGLLTAKRVGNQKHYQANRHTPIFEDLCALARKTFGVVDEVRDALGRLSSQPDLVILYTDPRDGPEPTIRVFLVSDGFDTAAARKVLADAGSTLGRELQPWVLDRRRFTDLLARQDQRLQAVLQGPKVVLAGSVEPHAW
jgi:DNA-binding transcriptional ArsR family regulator